MSHLKQRKEKSCLNCNAVLNGRYCSICGQENLEPQESVWHLIVHFFNDITHFDGKFFSSVKYVVTKPGFLSSEYVAGRRMSYLNPVRFYVFTSFIFFLILFTFFSTNVLIKYNETYTPEKKVKDSIKMAEVKNANLFNITPSNKEPDSLKNNALILNFNDYKNRAEYDSLKKLGKTTKKWYKKMLFEKQFDIEEKYGKDNKKLIAALKEKMASVMPQIIFLSLPFFALILKLLYVRRREYYYVAHAIFTLHFYIFIYIIILSSRITDFISKVSYLHWVKVITVIIAFSPIYYLYRAMRNFYGQGRLKTLLKIFIMSLFLVFLFCFFLILLLALSVYKM